MYTPEEQAEHRKQWVDALRSGKYQQTTGRLRDGDKFCCLGVACDISGLGEWRVSSCKESMSEAQDYHVNVFDEESGALPEKVMEWLGVQHPDVRTHYGEYMSLSIYNDSGSDFNHIASLIEAESKIVLTGDEYQEDDSHI